MSLRKVLATSIAVTLAAAVFALHATLPAHAGGGCHQPATDGSGTAIQIEGVCFGPTVLHIAPGDTVTWTNDHSGATHTITGASMSWGTGVEQIQPGASYAHQFTADGVYPYYCFLHPGMAGAVVVGGEAGDGAKDESASSAGRGLVWLLAPLAGAVVGMTAIGGYGLGRRRARR